MPQQNNPQQMAELIRGQMQDPFLQGVADDAAIKQLGSKLQSNQERALNQWGYTNPNKLLEGITLEDYDRLRRMSGGELPRILETQRQNLMAQMLKQAQ